MNRFRLGGPWYVVAGVLVLGFLVAVTASVKTGGYVMALALVGGAVMRAFLPERYVADIRVRARTIDTALYLGFALAIAVATSLVRA